MTKESRKLLFNILRLVVLGVGLLGTVAFAFIRMEFRTDEAVTDIVVLKATDKELKATDQELKVSLARQDERWKSVDKTLKRVDAKLP